MALRYHACSLVSLVGIRERATDAVDFVPPVSVRLISMETSGSLKFPSYPFVCMPCSKIPVVSLLLAIALRGLLTSAGSIRRLWLRCFGVILLTTTIHISGFNNTACKLAPPGSEPSLTGTHAGFATDLLARL